MSEDRDSYHFPLLLAALLLTLIGLVNLHSATVSYDESWAALHPSKLKIFFENHIPSLVFLASYTERFSSFFWSQAFYFFMGAGVMMVLAHLKPQFLFSLVPFVYGASLFLLALTLIIGATVHGSKSWISLGSVRLQPSEFAKPAFVLMLSRFLSGRQKEEPLHFQELIKPSVIFLCPFVLVLLQGDLGTGMFFCLIYASMLLFYGVQTRLLLLAFVLVIVGGGVAAKFFLKPHQQKRISSFLDPESDPRGSGYHLVQSKIAVGSGGIFGKGYLQGVSNKLKYIPERHTDFIFSVFAEEWGLVGAGVVLTLYMFFLIFGIFIARTMSNRFSIFVVIGLVSIFFWHLVVNLYGILGMMPLTGVPLPFLSYGGSSVLANWTEIGILMTLYRSRYTF